MVSIQSLSSHPVMARPNFQGRKSAEISFGSDTVELSKAPAADIFPGSGHYEQAVRMFSKPNGAELTLATEAGSVPNIWNNDTPVPYEAGDVVMYYGETDVKGVKKQDRNVSKEPGVMARSYINEATGEYLNAGTDANPVLSIQPGQSVKAVKKAPGRVLLVKPGTKVHTLETMGNKAEPITVQAGQCVVFDLDGNPYVQGIETFLLKKNDPAQGNALAESVFGKLQALYKAFNEGFAAIQAEIAAASNP